MKVLVLLAHADDESLGVGGSIPFLLEKGHEVELIIMSEGVVSMRAEATDNRKALTRACRILGLEKFTCLGFPDQAFETLAQAKMAMAVHRQLRVLPDIIITHASGALNLDHRITHQVAKVVGRPRQKPIGILGCEIPASAAWNHSGFTPNYYVDISPYLDQKIKAFAAYQEENRSFPDPFSPEGLRIQAHFRGMEAGYQAAEGFEVIRWYGEFLKDL